MTIQHKRGSTAQHSTYAGLPGEVTVDTDKKTLVLHLGGVAGGFPLAREGAAGGSATVMAAPTLTGTVQAIVGQTYVLSMSATPGLSGTSIASFEVTLPDNTKQTVTASSNSGSYTWTASGTVGQNKTFSVVATDTLGNKSVAASNSVTLANIYVNAATITSPANGATNIGSGPTVSTGSFGVTGGTDTHAATDWEIRTAANGGGALVWSSANDTVNKTTIAVPANTLAVSTTYYLRARHKGATYGYGGWGEVSFATKSQFEPTAGEAYQGGFYAGKIVVGGQTYALVVAPKASGHSAQQWKTTADNSNGTLSFNDGLANSNAMNSAGGHPAALFCRGLIIGGYNDWYLPSYNELEACYRNLKPTTDANSTHTSFSSWRSSGYNVPASQTANGENADSSPVGAAYTSGSPSQTTATAFQSGGAEAFYSAYYWSSTQFHSGYAWMQYFGNGYQTNVTKDNSNYVRAVRKVLI